MPETNKLTEVITNEVSLVRRGANGKRFALTKGLKMTEVIEAVLKTEAEGETEMLATLVDATEEQVELAKANYRLQVGFADKMDKDLFAQVSKTAYPVEEVAVEKAEEEPTVEIPEEVKKAVEAKDAKIEDLKKAADEKQERIETLEKAALRKGYIEVVEKDYKHVAGASTEELADLLMDLTAVSPELVERVTKTWGTENAVLETVGTVSKNDGVSQTPLEQIEAEADELVKSKGLTKAKAITQVAKEKPELYRAYKNQGQF